MKRFFIYFLIQYCIGATYIIYKGVDNNVRFNKSNASTIN